MKIYLEMVADLNRYLGELNTIFKPEYQIPLLTFDPYISTADFNRARNVAWDDLAFPHAPAIGVYFLLCYEDGSDNVHGLYIGKASFGSDIGHRLWTHLTPYRVGRDYRKVGSDGRVYYIDYIGALNLNSIHEGFLAASVEEFLIKRMRTRYRLLNKVGNSW